MRTTYLLAVAGWIGFTACELPTRAGVSSPPATVEVGEAAKPGMTPAEVLDDWHEAASVADQGRYLAHFAPDAVFLGTDATERWTLEEFSEYVKKYFPQGGWTYRPHDRFVMFSEDGEMAWFDEALTNDSYGELRGAGVLKNIDGEWKIVHYNMTFTIPNDVARDVIDVVNGAASED